MKEGTKLEILGKKQDTRFKPGQSGNPSGRPQGSRNKATLIAEQLIEGQAEELVQKCINMTKNGDATAMKVMMDRLIPPRRD